MQKQVEKKSGKGKPKKLNTRDEKATKITQNYLKNLFPDKILHCKDSDDKNHYRYAFKNRKGHENLNPTYYKESVQHDYDNIIKEKNEKLFNNPGTNTLLMKSKYKDNNDYLYKTQNLSFLKNTKANKKINIEDKKPLKTKKITSIIDLSKGNNDPINNGKGNDLKQISNIFNFSESETKSLKSLLNKNSKYYNSHVKLRVQYKNNLKNPILAQEIKQPKKINDSTNEKTNVWWQKIFNDIKPKIKNI